MLWYSSHRLNSTYCAVSIALFSSVALLSTAQAATMGETIVTSAQNEPLVAKIMMTDVNLADFSVSLANASVYQRMGLTPMPSMVIGYIPTSATTGAIDISTTQPVTLPFADIVLALNNKEQRKIIPKTLLLPLHSIAASTNPQQLTAMAITENQLPPLLGSNRSQPLLVRNGAPPQLVFDNSGVQPLIAKRSAPPLLNLSAENSFTKFDFQAAVQASAKPTLDNSLAKRIFSQNDIHQYLDVLTVQVTRTIVPKALANDAIVPMPSQIADYDQNFLAVTKPAAVSQQALSYTVQRHDNLSLISQHIAEKNNLDTHTVMAQIQECNPDAFFKQNINCLRVNAQLDLSYYKVVPSQQSLQSAIKAQRQQNLPANNNEPLTIKPVSNSSPKPILSNSAMMATSTDKAVATVSTKPNLEAPLTVQISRSYTVVEATLVDNTIVQSKRSQVSNKTIDNEAQSIQPQKLSEI